MADSSERLRYRREQARRRRAFRRRRAIAALGLLGIVALAVVAFSGGSSNQSQQASSGAQPASTGRGSGAALVKNARPQPDWVPYTGSVPILVYHALGNPPPGTHYTAGLNVLEPQFRQEIAWLAGHGYQGVTLDEVENAWYHGGTLPQKPIVITFDNGYPTQATLAPRVLGQYGWPGVLFLITKGHIGPSLLRPLIAKGWEVGSHSVTHPDLTRLSGAPLNYELTASRAYLKRTYRISADNFCYPSSKYNNAVIAAVRAAGYVGAVTEQTGNASKDRPMTLNRYEVLASTGVTGLASALGRGGAGR